MIEQLQISENMDRTPGVSRLLLVDDDPALVLALSGTLQIRLGYFTIDTCQTGMSAFDCITATPYDLIISDVSMPKMNGVQVLGAVKQVRPRTPVVRIS